MLDPFTSVSQLTQAELEIVQELAGLTYSDGDILYYDNGAFHNLGIGTTGQSLVVSAGLLPEWTTPAGGGDVTKVGTPVNNQLAVWTGNGTLEGTSDFTYDGTNLNLITGKNLQIAGSTILSDSAGTTTLSNIDALDATTEATIEAAIDTLANLTSIQSRIITLADAGADALFGWDDSAGAYQNLSAADALAALGITASAAELNILDGATLSTAELNILSGATLTTTELNYVDGVTSSIQTQLDNKQTLDATLTALAAYNTNGLLTQTAANTFTGRTITGTSNQVNVSNGNGVAGNPTLSLPQSIATSSTPQFAGIELSHATQNTLTASGGILSIEGVAIPTISNSATLTNKTISVDNNTISGIAASSFVLSNGSGNIDGSASQKAIPSGVVVGTTDTQTVTSKRMQPRTASSTTSSNLSPDLSTANVYYRTTQTATLTVDAPTGTPVIGEVILMYIDSAGAQTINFNATYIPFGAAFPATTTAGKTMMVSAQYNGTNWKTLWANAV